MSENARHVVQKLVQWLHCIVPEIMKLVDEDLCGFVRNGGYRDGEGLVGEEVAIIS